MVSFQLGKELSKDVFLSCHECGTKKNEKLHLCEQVILVIGYIHYTCKSRLYFFFKIARSVLQMYSYLICKQVQGIAG